MNLRNIQILKILIKPKALFIIFNSVILLLVVLPLNGNSELNHITILRFRGDYFFHVLMFLPWAIFSKSLSKKIWIWLLLGILIAMLAEGIQYFIPYRAFNVNDALANTIGVILGFIIFAAFKWALQNFNNKRKRK